MARDGHGRKSVAMAILLRRSSTPKPLSVRTLDRWSGLLTAIPRRGALAQRSPAAGAAGVATPARRERPPEAGGPASAAPPRPPGALGRPAGRRTAHDGSTGAGRAPRQSERHRHRPPAHQRQPSGRRPGSLRHRRVVRLDAAGRADDELRRRACCRSPRHGCDRGRRTGICSLAPGPGSQCRRPASRRTADPALPRGDRVGWPRRGHLAGRLDDELANLAIVGGAGGLDDGPRR